MNIAALNVKIGADLSEFDKKMNALTGNIQALGNKMANAGKALSMGVTLPLIGIATVGTKMAADLDKSLREVNTLFGETGAAAEASFKDISATVKDLSKDVGIAQDTITKGLYQAISAGVPRENAFTFMQVASKAAIAGVTDVNTAVDGLTTIINAFGKEASEAGAVADSMFTAVKGGKTTFEELSNSLFNIAPAAAAANVSMEEVNAGLATLTAAGVPTAIATTQLRAALVGLQKPSAELDKIFQNLGYENAQMAIEAKGLGFALDAVKKAANGNNGTLQKLLGSVEAVAAANVLAGTGAEKFAAEMKAQQNAAGSTQMAFEEMNKSYARMGEKAKVALENIGIEIGRVMLPIVGKLANFVENLANKFNGLSDNTKRAIVVLGGIAAALGPALFIIGKIMTLLPTLIVGIKAVGVAFAAMTGPIGIAVAAIVGAAILIYSNWDRIVKFFSSGSGSKVFERLGKLVSTIFAGIQKAIKTAVDFGIELWDRFGGSIMKVVNTALQPVQRAFKYVFDQVINILDLFINIFSKNWKGVWDSALKIVHTFTNFIVDSISGMVTGTLSLFGKLASGLGADKIAGALNSASSSVQGFADGLKVKFKDVDSKVNETAANMEGIGTATQSATGVATAAVEGLSGSLEGLSEGSKYIQDIYTKLGIAEEKARFFGKSFDGFNEKTKIISQGITSAFDEGYKSGSEVIQRLQGELDKLNFENFAKNAANIKPIEVKIKPVMLDNAASKMPEINIAKTGLGALLEVQKQFDIANEKALAFGGSFDLIGEKASILQSAISRLLENGFNAGSGAVEALKTKLKELETTMAEVTVNISGIVQDGLISTFELIGETLGRSLSGAGDGMKSFFDGFLGILASFLGDFGKMLIAAGVARMALDKLLVTPGAGGVAIAAGVALVALAGAAKGFLAKGMNGGGSGGGGGSYSGESYGGGSSGVSTARLGMQTATAQPVQKIEFEGKLQGRDIVFIANQENKKGARVGG